MRTFIEVEEYCKAFETWKEIAAHCVDMNWVTTGIFHIRKTYSGVQPIQKLCDALRELMNDIGEFSDKNYDEVSALRLAVEKSCLLDRMIYAGEKLRTRK